MKQDSFRVSFSLANKILLNFLFLIFLFVTSLTLITVFLFQNEKKEDVYQNQLMAATLVGKEFFHFIESKINTVREIQNLIIFKTDTRKDTIKEWLSHQFDFLKNENYFYFEDKKKIQKIDSFQKKTDLKEEDFLIENFIHSLKSKSPLFFSKSVHDEIVIMIGSLQPWKENQNQFLISLCWFSLNTFKNEYSENDWMVLDESGLKFFQNDFFSFEEDQKIKEHPLFQMAKEKKIQAGTKEFFLNGKKYLGSFYVPHENWIVLIQREWHQAMFSTYKMIEKFILIGILGIGLTIFFSIFFSKKMTAPLEKLQEATLEISRGNFSVQLQEKGSDEFSSLSHSFNFMSQKILDLIDSNRNQVEVENELKIASMVQQTLLPSVYNENKFLTFESYYQSASQCGGDWWNFFQVKNQICFMIADATGHGLPSALITAAARGCFSIIEKISQENEMVFFSPSQMLSFCNRVIFDASRGKVNMTFFIGIFDFDEKKISYSNAGHNPPWLFKKDHEKKVILKSLIASGPRLGESIEEFHVEEKTTSFEEGDLFFFYTDGLTEGKDKKGDPYGKKRLKNLLMETIQHFSIQEIRKVIQKDFLSYNEDKELDDDVTFILCQVNQKND